jgi:hypothetical protein
MVTDVLHLFVAPDDLSCRADLTIQAPRVADGVLHQAREMFCGLRGHEHMVQFQQGRMFMRCLLCGHESSGWELNQRAPMVTAPRRPRPHLPAAA